MIRCRFGQLGRFLEQKLLAPSKSIKIWYACSDNDLVYETHRPEKIKIGQNKKLRISDDPYIFHCILMGGPSINSATNHTMLLISDFCHLGT